MFNFLKKKKYTVVGCKTDEVLINNKRLTFPTNHDMLVSVLGKPSRILHKSKHYIYWDSKGIMCAYEDANIILALNFYQNKKDKSEYNTKNQFNGGLFLNDENITNNEFTKIPLGNIAILRLGSENEFRFGFSIGVNRDYKH